MWNFVAVWLVTTLSLLIITRLSLGIDARNGGTAIIAALVLGLLNAFLGPILTFLSFPFMFLTLGLFAVVINAFLIWITGKLVNGFRVDGVWSAILGAIMIGVLNTVIFRVLG